MRSRVNLVYLAKPNVGGWASFTVHLLHGLRKAGYQPHLWKCSKRDENRLRPFGFGESYVNASLATLETLTTADPVVITAVTPAESTELAVLTSAGAGVVIHDPTELRKAVPDILAQSRGPLWCIRPTMRKHIPSAEYLPHPYSRAPGLLRTGQHWAVAFSRVDWDKHTELIVEANQKLREFERVRIHGAENRLYAHHKLPPSWRQDYHGPMARDDLWAGARLAADAYWAVDMSAIKGDGGGTQYTFLEALDGGAKLIINAAWLTGDPDLDIIAPYVSVVSNADELAALLAGGTAQRAADADALLAEHDSVTVARQLMATF